MTDLTIRKRGPISGNSQYADAELQTGGIDVDQDAYTAGLDRIYNVKGLDNMHVEIKNTGIIENGLTYRIDKARNEVLTLSALVDADFDEEIKADTNVAASQKADGTITIASPVANTFADGDIVCASVLEADTVTINNLLYTAVNGAKSDNTEFDMSGTDDQCAADLADSITQDTRSGTAGDQTATSSTDTVTVTTDVLGTAGNAITLISSNGTRLAVTGSGFLTGGVTADIVTANDLIYTAVVGAKANDTEFSIDGDDAATALDLADSIDDDVRVGTLNDLTATAATNVVTAVQTVPGTGGNATTLTSSDGTRLAVSGAVFTGGTDAATSITDITTISPAITAIRIRVKRESAGLDTILAGIVSVD